MDHAPGLGGTQNNPLSTTPAPNVFSRQGVGDLRGGKASLMPRHIQARGTQSRLLAGRFPSNRNALPKSVVVRCRRRSEGAFFCSKSDCRPGSLPGAGHTVTIIGWQIPIKQKRSSEERCCSMSSPIWGLFFVPPRPGAWSNHAAPHTNPHYLLFRVGWRGAPPIWTTPCRRGGLPHPVC